jgi:membrane-associated phospholipid phosphatase
MTRLALALLLVATTAAAEPPNEDARARARKRNFVITLATGTAYVLTEAKYKDSLDPDDCRWCRAPSIDVGARNALVWSEVHDARIASDVAAHLAVPVFAIGAVNLTLVGHDADWGDVFDVSLPVLESAFASQVLTYFVKGAVGRERPDRHFDRPGSDVADKNISFWSGHTALAFAFASSAGTVASMRKSRAAPIIWGVGLTLATATGYLRIAGDRHYLTDVAMGATVGLATGYLIPRLMQYDLALTSSGRDVILVGTF